MADQVGGRYRSAIEQISRLESATTVPENSSLSQILAVIFSSEPVTIENRWYNSQEVNLDGFNFVRCRFDNCKFVVGKGMFRFDHCLVAGGSALYSEDAGRIVRFYSLPAGNGSDLPKDQLIRPVWHEDGTFSIG